MKICKVFLSVSKGEFIFMEREEILSIVQVTFQKNVQLDSALDEEFELYELDDYDSLTHFSVLIELLESQKFS